MALRPVKGRAVWALTPRSVIAHPHRPLAAGLDQRARRLAEHGRIPRQELGPRLPQLEETALVAADLLTGVEAPGDVDRRLAHGRRQIEHDGEPSLHVRRADAPQGVAVEPRDLVAGRRDRVEVARQDETPAVAERGAGDDVVPDALDLEPGARRERLLDHVGQGRPRGH